MDRRKNINFYTLRKMQDHFFKPIARNGMFCDIIIGNHDTAFKNTNEYNSMNELFSHSRYMDNIAFHPEPTEIEVGGLKLALLPWICSGNYKQSMEFIRNTRCKILLGHLELNGFEMHRGSVCEGGLDASIFSNFDRVFTGHFHHKSTKGNISYLGSPYELTWHDYDDPRGFHIFDTETLELEFIRNTDNLFYKIPYNEVELTEQIIKSYDFTHLTDKYVKIIASGRSDPYLFKKFEDAIEKVKPLDVQVIDESIYYNKEDNAIEISDVEDTPTILKGYIDKTYSGDNAKEVHSVLLDIYHEAKMLVNP